MFRNFFYAPIRYFDIEDGGTPSFSKWMATWIFLVWVGTLVFRAWAFVHGNLPPDHLLVGWDVLSMVILITASFGRSMFKLFLSSGGLSQLGKVAAARQMPSIMTEDETGGDDTKAPVKR